MVNHPNDPRMNPQEQYKLIVFVLLITIAMITYDSMVLRPHNQKLAESKKVAQNTNIKAIPSQSETIPQYQSRKNALANSERVKIENDMIFGSINLTGARIDDISLKNHYKTIRKKDNISVLSPLGTRHSRFAEFGWLSNDESIKTPTPSSVWSIKESFTVPDKSGKTSKTGVILQWNNGQGVIFERTYTLDDGYMITMTENVINNTKDQVSLYPYALVSQNGLPENYSSIWTMHEGPIGYISGDLEEISYKKLNKDGDIIKNSQNGWIGIAEKYWIVSIIPEQQNEKTFRFVQKQKNANNESPNVYQVDIRGNSLTIEPDQTLSYSSNLFAGAKKLSMLDQYEKSLDIKHFDLAIDFGMWYFLTKPLMYLLTFLNGIAGNFGIAIIMLTLIVRGAVFPLANTSYKSFANLRKISPQMKEIQTKYANDKKRMQEELVKLYEKEKVNPMSGCLPILVQIPIFFALYKVISINIDMRHEPFFGWIQDLTAKDPTSVFNLFGLLPYDVPDFLVIGIWPCLLLGTLILQKSMSPPPQDEFQKTLINGMPWVMTFMMSKFASGLVIYWTFSAILSVLQQYIIMRSMGVEVKFFQKHPIENKGESKEDKSDQKNTEKPKE